MPRHPTGTVHRPQGERCWATVYDRARGHRRGCRRTHLPGLLVCEYHTRLEDGARELRGRLLGQEQNAANSRRAASLVAFHERGRTRGRVLPSDANLGTKQAERTEVM